MKKRYWLWVALAIVGVLVGARAVMQKRYLCNPGPPTGAADIIAICQSLTEYAINNNGTYPTSLEPLVTPDAQGHCYLEGYNGELPLDPWKRPYHYEIPTSAYPHPHVWTYGADGKLGGTGENADTDSEAMKESG